MTEHRFRYFRGHCGHDHATVCYAPSVPEDIAQELALRVLDEKGGLECGLLTDAEGGLRLRVVDTTTRRWVSMCGGITQLIGKILATTHIYPINWTDSRDPEYVKLFTDAGTIPIGIWRGGDEVETHMDAYAAYIYERYKPQVRLIFGCPVVDMGEYIIVHTNDLAWGNQEDIDFTVRTPGDGLEIVDELLKRHHSKCAMLYDMDAEYGVDMRIFPRFLDKTAKENPYEFHCGTGAVAVVMALAFMGDLPKKLFPGRQDVRFQWGSGEIDDPMGLRRTVVWYTRHDDGRIDKISFMHRHIVVSEEGELIIGV